MRRRIRDWLFPKVWKLYERWKRERRRENFERGRGRLRAWNGNPEGDGEEIHGVQLALADKLRSPARIAKRTDYALTDPRRRSGMPEGSPIEACPQDLVGDQDYGDYEAAIRD